MILRDSDIIEAIATRLENMSIDSGNMPVNIFKSRYIKLNDSEFPAINILLHDKVFSPTNDTGYNVADRDVTFQLIVKGNDTSESVDDHSLQASLENARDLIEELETNVRDEFNKKNECLSGFDRRIKSFTIKTSSIMIDTSGNHIIGICIMEYSCKTVDKIDG